MPIVLIDRCLFSLPAVCNVLFAVTLPGALAAGFVAWPYVADNVWLGVCLDHFLAFLIVYAGVMPFLSANFLRPAGSMSARAARMSSSLGLAACVIVIVAKMLGRTVMLAIALGFVLFEIQLSSWGESLVVPLQSEGALHWIPTRRLQHALSCTPLELIGQLRRSGLLRWLTRLIHTIRALATLVLLPEEEKDDAIALLHPELVERLETPVVSQLPSAVRVVLEPWGESEHLRLRKGLMPMIRRGLRLSGEGEDAAAAAMAAAIEAAAADPTEGGGMGAGFGSRLNASGDRALHSSDAPARALGESRDVLAEGADDVKPHHVRKCERGWVYIRARRLQAHQSE